MDTFIENFQTDDQIDKEKTNNNDENVVLGEWKKSDEPIVMDDVSGLADKSNNFGSLVTFKKILLRLHSSFPHVVSIKTW